MSTIKNNTFCCRSAPNFWEKEKNYLKRNTVRSALDLRADQIKIEDIEKCEKIQIYNTVTNQSFCRKISDVSMWNYWVIISW